eukprot:CAMPEP_0196577768 /NCGR_PEP_ID=MMETSP1081-20130531/6782_1 /TAXON_ID=36882 /ORGANISM="Pyramimonas amylifera, Strain CCMP720" /LENGTH=270 /DNA_ID=CAMNT_0041896779 /DNA_START=89 /DNA_END=901 /DNA_ORIENTATION=+
MSTCVPSSHVCAKVAQYTARFEARSVARSPPRLDKSNNFQHGLRLKSRTSSTPINYRRMRIVTESNAASGFIMDMSDLIQTGSMVKINTEKECALGVSLYPDFAYNAEGGGGMGRVTSMDVDGKVAVNFDPLTLNIPALETATADLLGLPLPPLFKGEIRPISLSGFIEKRSGKVDLQFEADIVPSVTKMLVGKPLKLFMNLTTETSWGATRSARGKRLDSEGRCVLVGVARLPPSSDPVSTTLLMLPSDCLAVLQVRFEFYKNMSGRPN